MSEDRHAALAAYSAQLKQKYKHGLMTTAASVEDLIGQRISSGILALDLVYGGNPNDGWGLLRGKVHCIIGEESSGKTEKLSRFIAQAQKLCRHCMRPAKDMEVEPIDYPAGKWEPGMPTHRANALCDCVLTGVYIPKRLIWVKDGKEYTEKDADFEARVKELKKNSYSEFVCALIDLEGTWDSAWAERLGVDNRRLYYIRAEYAEQALDIHTTMLESGNFDLIGLDSIAQLELLDDLNTSAEDTSSQRPAAAKKLNEFCRKVPALLNDQANRTGLLTTMIWLQQWRQKMMKPGMHGSDKVMPIGKGQRFLYATILDCWATGHEIEERQVGANKDDTIEESVRVKMNFRTEKNKTAPPKKSSFYRMALADTLDKKTGEKVKAGDVMELDFVLGAAERFNFILKEGNKYYVNVCGVKKEFSTQKAYRELFKTDVQAYEHLKRLILTELSKPVEKG